MALATTSSDQTKLLNEKGVKLPRTTSGMNKLAPMDLMTQKTDERSKAVEPKESASEKKKRESKHTDIVAKAKNRFSGAISVESTNRKSALDDLKFLNGEQWSAADAQNRASEGRPCLTENRIPTFVNQITNDQRQNRPAICISPMGDKSSKKDAKILRGMIRAIERDSNADVAYDTGFASAVHNGWGYWRIVTEYESEKSFHKVISIK